MGDDLLGAAVGQLERATDDPLDEGDVQQMNGEVGGVEGPSPVGVSPVGQLVGQFRVFDHHHPLAVAADVSDALPVLRGVPNGVPNGI